MIGTSTIRFLSIHHWAARLLMVSVGLTGPIFPQVGRPVELNLTSNRSLHVVALAGDGETNDMETRVMAPLVIQVLDRNARPVEGADVTFRFPTDGPSASFPHQRDSRIVKTNADGQAAAVGWISNGQAGLFQVQVVAVRGNDSGGTVISMTNVIRTPVAKKNGHKQ